MAKALIPEEGYFEIGLGFDAIVSGQHPLRQLASDLGGRPMRALGHVSTVLNVDKNLSGPISHVIERTLGR